MKSKTKHIVRFVVRGLCLVFVLVLFVEQSFGQSLISGYVQDKQGNSIPYATVVFQGVQRTATASDGSGYFELNVDLKNVEKGNLVIRAVGFENDTIPASSIQKRKDKIIYKLQKKEIDLKPVEILAKKSETVWLGAPLKRKGIDSFGIDKPFEQFGLLINKNTKNPLYVKSVRVQFGASLTDILKTAKGKVRLRLYAFDPKKNKPTDNLLHENVIIEVDAKTKEVNLSQYYISIPENGIVVALEWVEDNKLRTSTFKDRGQKHEMRNFGPVLKTYRPKAKHFSDKYRNKTFVYFPEKDEWILFSYSSLYNYNRWVGSLDEKYRKKGNLKELSYAQYIDKFPAIRYLIPYISLEVIEDK